MAFQGFVNLLLRPDISLEERLMVCKTLANLSASSAVNSLKIIRTNGLPEAFSSILRETGSALGYNNTTSSVSRIDERHQTYIALCISRCASKSRLSILGEGIYTEVCLKLARTEGLVDGLWALKKHPEAFVQICSAVALSTLCQCDEAVGINRRLMRFKWNSNALQLPAPPLTRSLGLAPASGDDLTHTAQTDMWRIEENQILPAHTAASHAAAPHPPSAVLAAYSAGVLSNPVPSIRFPPPAPSAAAPQPSLQPAEWPTGAHAAVAVGPFPPAPHQGISAQRWEGVADGLQAHTVEKEDSWASARETKPGAGYYSSQARCRSPYSSGGHSSGPFGSGAGVVSEAASGVAGGAGVPPRVYSRTDVNFDASSITHCISIGSPSHPAREQAATRLSGTGSGGSGAVSTSRDALTHLK